MKKTVCILLALLTILSVCVGCQKTPESPIIVGKANDGWKEEEISSEEIASLNIPESYESKITEGALTININSDVQYQADKPFPIYILQKGSFSQEQADSIMAALIGDAVLYDLSDTRTKEIIQQEIKQYTGELEAADSEDNRAFYQEKLKELMAELDTAPEQETTMQASRVLEFKESEDLSWEYAREIKNKHGGLEYIWTDEGRNRAAADGNTEISGYCTLQDGRRMRFAIRNRSQETSSVQFGYADESPDANGETTPISEEEAIAKGNELMEQIGGEYEFLGSGIMVDNNSAYWLSYCTAIPGTNRTLVEAAPLLNTQAEYSEPLKQETIQIQISGNGVEYFYWDAPISVASMDSENMGLMSWDEIVQIMEKGLRVKNLWDYEDEAVTERRLDIDKICLSYMQVRKASDLSSSYYVPVWDVIGTMHHVYSGNYSPSPGSGFVLDENNERTAYSNCSVLTINAIDGTIIDRSIGY